MPGRNDINPLPQTALNLARDLLKQKQFGQALVAGNDVLASQPGNLDALWIVATAYCELGDDASAERHLRACLQRDPNNTDAVVRLVTCLRRQRRQAEARQYLEQSLSGNAHPAIAAELAALLLDEGNSDLAILNASKALELDPENLTALMSMGSALILLGTPREALKYLLSARELSPSNPQVYINLAAAYEQFGDWQQQIEQIELALLCDNNLWGLRLLLGELYLRQTRWRDAMDTFSVCLSQAPEHLQANWGMAQACRASGLFDRAREALLQVVRVQPESVEAWVQLGDCFLALDNVERARLCREQVVELDPRHYWLRQFPAQD